MIVETEIIEWQGCYDDSWKGLITDESFAHPAKFAPGLITRILKHGLARGYWCKGDLIGDPFGGIAGGGIMAGFQGFNWLGVELEPRFVALGSENIALHAPTWRAFDSSSLVKLVQGDSRNFASIAGAIAAALTSPPYGETLNHGGGPDTKHDRMQGGKSLLGLKSGYGETPGQIGSLANGDVDAVITSPPFGETQTGRGIAKSPGTDGNVRIGGNCGYQNQADSAGNIAALPMGNVVAVITSPPYAESVKGDHKERETSEESHAARTDPGAGGGLGRSQRFGGYGATEGNIGNLKEGVVDGIATSPPFASSDTKPTKLGAGKASRGGGDAGGRNKGDYHYPTSEGQIGITEDETYWQAMHTVYTQCFIALRPGGYMAVVVKDYVKSKARVPLCDQSHDLLLSIGFEPVERIHASLVKTTTRDGLFGVETKTVERKSFFRRLHEKNGSPRIDFEEVLIVRKPPAESVA